MKITKFNIFKVTLKVVTWIFQEFNLKISGRMSDYIDLILRLDRLLYNRGALETLKYIKGTRTAYLAYLSGKPVRVKGVRTTKDGIPVILGDFVPKIRKGPTPAMLQLINTILFCTRALKLGRTPDFSPIINPPKRDPINIGEFVDDFWRDMGYHRQARTNPKSLDFRKFHLTTKSGPNGTANALWTSLNDLKALSEQQLTDIGIIGGENLRNKISALKEGLSKIPELSYFIDTSPGIYTRRITSFPDKELKVRVIAVGDYFSQAALKPLHDYLFRVLKKIPQDCTFNQGAFWDKIKDQEYYASIDLTAATDRFPISTISQVLLGRLPESYVNAWSRLMVGTPFTYEGQEINYAVGNPMGFYSSWASFAVAHHYVVYYCCKKLGIPWKTLKYCLLGDDIVICDPKVAALYKETISGLGVEFSEEKTITSPHLVEFAKRLIYKGTEISPFPISALGELASKYYLLTNLFLELEKKGWVSLGGAPSAVESFHKIVLNWSTVRAREIEVKASICERVMKIARGAENAGTLLTECFRKLGYPFVLSDFVARNVLENIVVENFAKSNPASHDPERDKKKKRPCVGLGILAENLTCLLSGLDEERFSLGFDLISTLPHLNAYGQISEMYIEINKKARKISTTNGAEWPLLFKTMCIPWDDTIFTMRSSHLIAKGSSRVVKDLQNRAELLSFYPPEELLREDPNFLKSL
uniref:RNA-dependent RNA polymerase n=1 Tax=Entomophthora muscae mitovirus 7 TaxID=2557980 RepID=A0A499WM38_9VIRU|nr:TPA_inf: RNA-dependent RNA polymerase [Entomophthora muscae mitovirus 7]